MERGRKGSKGCTVEASHNIRWTKCGSLNISRFFLGAKSHRVAAHV